MGEWKRIFFSQAWLGVLALLLICNVALYAFEQTSSLYISVREYDECNDQWTQTLSELTPEQGLAALQSQQNNFISWSLAEWLVQDEDAGTLNEADLAYYRENYPNIDAQMEAIRAGQAVEDGRAQETVVEYWMERQEYWIGYEARIQSVAEQAQRIRSNPLFSAPGSFAYRNAEQTEEDYLSISGITFTTHPNDVMESLLNNRANLIFSLCLVAVTVVLLLEPRRLGLEMVERSYANGRCVLTLRRILALLIAAFVATILMIGSVLVAGMVLYGQSVPLGMPVQNMEYFQNWTANTAIGGFLIWMVLFRTGGLWLTGLLLWLVLSRFKSLPVGLVISGAFLLLEYRWFGSYGINDAGYPLASVNLFHLLSAEDVAGRYFNYDLFGCPVNERIFLPVLLILFIAVCTGVLLLTTYLSRGTRRNGKLAQWLEKLAVHLRRHRKNRPLWRYEGRKLLLYCGGLLILAAGVVFLRHLEVPYLWMDQEEGLLVEYTRVYAGELSEETFEEIKTAQAQAWEEYNQLTELTAENTMGVNISSYRARCDALDRLAERYQGLISLEDESVQLVDETPLERIYGMTGKNLRLQGAACALLTLCLLIPGLFSLENRYGIRPTLLSAANGRSKLWRIKAFWAYSMAGIVWLFWTVRELLLLHGAQMRWEALAAKGLSVGYWNDLLGSMPIGTYITGLYLLRLVGLLCAGSLMLLIASRWSALLTAAGLGVALMLLPQLLSLMGPEGLEPISWCAQLAGPSLTLDWLRWLWLVVWGTVGITCALASQLQWRRYRS